MAKRGWDQNHFARSILEGLKQTCTKTLHYAKLADIEQREKETPGKFLDRLQEDLCKFNDIDSKRSEGEMILNDKFLTQLAPDIWHKLQKQEFGPNKSLENCCSWLRWYIMVENTRRKIGGRKNQAKDCSPNNGC